MGYCDGSGIVGFKKRVIEVVDMELLAAERFAFRAGAFVMLWMIVVDVDNPEIGRLPVTKASILVCELRM